MGLDLLTEKEKKFLEDSRKLSKRMLPSGFFTCLFLFIFIILIILNDFFHYSIDKELMEYLFFISLISYLSYVMKKNAKITITIVDKLTKEAS